MNGESDGKHDSCSEANECTDPRKEKYDIDVVIGTHPVPQSYYNTHQALGTWSSQGWKEKMKYILTDEQTRLRYS